MNSLIDTLHERFEKNMHRHQDILWLDVESRINKSPQLSILEKMESTGGEPDIVGYDNNTQEYIWMDCSKESPTERRSLCYDNRALESRKENKPKGSVLEIAKSMGASLLSEEEYKYLQSLEPIDLKTSSWIATPDDVRSLGGALFGDRRYNRVFTYHNGAESYYAARGWRGSVRI